jgi:hypothetical protein
MPPKPAAAPAPGTPAQGTAAPGTPAPGTPAQGTAAPGTAAQGTAAPAPGTAAQGTPGTEAQGTPGTEAPAAAAPGIDPVGSATAEATDLGKTASGTVTSIIDPNSTTSAYDTIRNTAASKISSLLTKQTDKIVKPLMTAIVPMELRSDPEIKQILAKKQQQIKDQEAKMIEKSASSGADSALKVALAIPVTGNMISLASAVDSGATAFKNLFSGFNKIKNEIVDLKKKVCQVKARVAAAKNAKCGAMPHLGLPKINSLSSKMPSVPNMGFGKTQTQKGGSLRKSKNKINYSEAERALHRTRRSIEYFQDPTKSKKYIYSSPSHLKTRKLYANKILDRTSKSISAFSG